MEQFLIDIVFYIPVLAQYPSTLECLDIKSTQKCLKFNEISALSKRGLDKHTYEMLIDSLSTQVDPLKDLHLIKLATKPNRRSQPTIRRIPIQYFRPRNNCQLPKSKRSRTHRPPYNHQTPRGSASNPKN